MCSNAEAVQAVESKIQIPTYSMYAEKNTMWFDIQSSFSII